MLKDDSAQVRHRAAALLARLGDDEARGILLDVLKANPYWGLQRPLFEALGSLRDLRALDYLLPLLAPTNDGGATVSAYVALGLLGDPRGIDPVLK